MGSEGGWEGAGVSWQQAAWRTMPACWTPEAGAHWSDLANDRLCAACLAAAGPQYCVHRVTSVSSATMTAAALCAAVVAGFAAYPC
jgi:hypothetical protein